jgi:hypothetical protein
MRVLALAATAAATAVSERAFLAESKKQSPIRKIVTLLEDMVKQMQSEKEEDDAVYAKLVCWCKKNRQEQTGIREKAVADYDSAIASAKEAFGEMQALEEKRNNEFAQRSSKAKEEATFRESCAKEAKEFNSRDIELKETIKAAKTAVTILEGGQSLLQTKKSQLDTLMRKLLESRAVDKLAESKPEALIALQSYVDNAAPAFLQQPVGYQSYASQSDGVVGMLKQMIEDLGNQISEGARAEEERRSTCTAKLAALNEEVAALGESIDAKDKRIGELAADNADAKAAADEARTTRLNAQEFLAKLNVQCQEADQQYASRTASRNDEIKACSETIEILDSDEAFASFGKNIKATEGPAVFLQIGRSDASLAAWTLESAAKKNPRIFFVQTLIKSAQSQGSKAGVFDGVLKAIDELIGELKAEQVQEVADRDNCIETENSLKRQVDDTRFHLQSARETSEELAAKIAALAKEIEAKQTLVAEINADVAEATSIREAEAKEFATASADHKETQVILQKAIERMGQVYKSLLEQPGADVVEFGATADTPGSAPAAFKKSGGTVQNDGGNKVVTLLTKVLGESKAESTKSEQAESDAIAQYNEFMRISTRDKKAAEEAIAAKTERSVNAVAAKKDADSDADSLTKTLTGLVEETLDTQKNCAFLMKNFTVRQQKRVDEIESLATAKQYLKGMN